MPYPYPEYLRDGATENEKRLWDCLWRTIEKLNLAEEELRELSKKVKQMEDRL